MKKGSNNPQIVAFEGGAITKLAGRGEGREAVLALPLSRLIVKMVRVPKDAESAEAFATPILQKMSPFPDDPLTVGCETVRESEQGTVVLAAAIPESSADDIAEALDAEKLSVMRIDALVLGELRGLWAQINGEGGISPDARKLVLIKSADCISILALDGDGLSAIRAILDESDLRREIMLSLLEAEDFGGEKRLAEIVLVGELVGEGLDALAPVRKIEFRNPDAALLGIADRNAEEGTLNALPASWREVLNETRFKAKMTRHLAVAIGIWALVMGVLFGVPVAYGFMTDYQKGLSKRHQKQYKAVKEMFEKTAIVRKYRDHSHGALEIMKALSDRLPEDITLSSWNYKREEGVRVQGDSDSSEGVYEFKDQMDALSTGEDGEGEKVFNEVFLNGPTQSKNGQRFNLDCLYKAEGEE